MSFTKPGHSIRGNGYRCRPSRVFSLLWVGVSILVWSPVGGTVCPEAQKSLEWALARFSLSELTHLARKGT